VQYIENWQAALTDLFLSFVGADGTKEKEIRSQLISLLGIALEKKEILW
jgi:hypothetical protein